MAVSGSPLNLQQVDREQVLTKGAEVSGRLLIDIQVRKCIADGQGARDFYKKLTTPFDGWETELRDLVLSKKQVRLFREHHACFYHLIKLPQPRKLFVQPNTFIDADDKVVLKEYPLTPVGLIQSFLEREL